MMSIDEMRTAHLLDDVRFERLVSFKIGDETMATWRGPV